MYLKQHFVDFQVVCSGIVQKLPDQNMELQEVYIRRHRIHLHNTTMQIHFQSLLAPRTGSPKGRRNIEIDVNLKGNQLLIDLTAQSGYFCI